MDPTQLAQVLIPRPYTNIAELLGTLGQLLILAERSQDDQLKDRYIKLFDVMFKGLSLYMDKEFYQVGPDNVLSLSSKIKEASNNPLVQFTNQDPDKGDDPPKTS